MCNLPQAQAQEQPPSGLWAFVHGSHTPEQESQTGGVGVFSDGNYPGSRRGSVSWKDSLGNLWLFGGYGNTALGTGQLNDLWKYDVSLGQWALMKGSTWINQPGTYGGDGVFDSFYQPAAREGAVSWTDADDNLWLFGGDSQDTMETWAEMWQYDISKNQWARMSTLDPYDPYAHYLQVGQFHRDNTPGERRDAVSWSDRDGNLWLFGGFGADPQTNTTGIRNDLWKYDVKLGQWAFIKGSSALYEPGNYGIGSSDPAARPGARYQAMSWTDLAGNLWMFGGRGYAQSSSSGALSDLWKYDVISGNWVYIKGPKAINLPGIYGPWMQPDGSSYPGARQNAFAWFNDTTEDLWLFGGAGFGEFSFSGQLNDLWKFDTSTGNWAFMKGSKEIDQRGEAKGGGVFHRSNVPGAREAGHAWSGANGELWLWGGDGYTLSSSMEVSGELADLWKFNPDLSANTAPIAYPDPQTPGDLQFTIEQNKPLTIAASALLANDTDADTDVLSLTNLIPGTGTASVSYDSGTRTVTFTPADSFTGTATFTYRVYDGMLISNTATVSVIVKATPPEGNWAFMKGATVAEDRGLYGSEEAFDPNYNPSGRTEAAYWKDKDGNFWLFGGIGPYSSSSAPVSQGHKNDLWKYNVSSGQWAYMKGSLTIAQTGSHGDEEQFHPSFTPGARARATTWTDANGDLWLFGGYENAPSSSGYRNDLWKYEVSRNQWAYMKGFTDLPISVHGEDGEFDPTYRPGVREGACSWTDDAGNLWLFGGSGYTVSGSGLLNDLWKYDVSLKQWACMKSSPTADQPGTYGDEGDFDPAYMPGARHSAVTWKDTAGNLWLFGGYGHQSSGTGGLNDLWKYDIVRKQWAYMKGSQELNHPGEYGPDGTPGPDYKPKAAVGAASWTDSAGDFWLFGGIYQGSTASEYVNDLWKYDVSNNQWAFMKGSKGTSQYSKHGTAGFFDAAYNPGGRQYPMAWIDAHDDLWLFGGLGFTTTQSGRLSDLWKYDTPAPVSNLPIAKADPEMPGDAKFATDKNVTLSIAETDLLANDTDADGDPLIVTNLTPGTGTDSVTLSAGVITFVPATDFTGTATFTYTANDGTQDSSVATVSITVAPDTAGEWAWMSGSNIPTQAVVPGPAEEFGPNYGPGGRRHSASWTDKDGNLWLFGGDGVAESSSRAFNDLWKYDVTRREWAFVKGATQHSQYAIYGQPGEFAETYKPGGIMSASSWIDADGDLWLFGGEGYTKSRAGYLDFMWKFDVSERKWAWMSGSGDTVVNSPGVYAAKEVFDGTSSPGGRQYSNSWIDAEGDLWLFGGLRYHATAREHLNDLWKYDVSENKWGWMSGSEEVNQSGVYGEEGAFDATYAPGARRSAKSWTDSAGNFWLFGGWGIDGSVEGYLSDLWKYDVSQKKWALIKGADGIVTQYGVYGAEGEFDPTYKPGGRNDASCWIDAADDLWLFGGYGFGPNNMGQLNDLWKFDVSKGQWAYMKGKPQYINRSGDYGTKGIFDGTNMPGGRSSAVSWMDTAGDLWLFGGNGYGGPGAGTGLLNDVWKYDAELTIDSNAAPVAADDPATADDAAFLTRQNFSLSIAAADLLANDSDADSDPLTITNLNPVTGTESVAISDGIITFIPEVNFSGTATFTYTANDGTIDSNVATVSVTVDGVIVPPTPSSARDFPPAPFFLRANSENTPQPENGDTSQDLIVGPNFLVIAVPLEWPADSDLVVDLLSPDMNSLATSTSAIADSSTGIVDVGFTAVAPTRENNSPTRFTLYEAGSTFDSAHPSDPVTGNIVQDGDHTFAPNAVPDSRYHRLVTIPAEAVTTGGRYVLRVETLTAGGPASNPSGNGFRVRAGTDTDSDPNNGGVLDDVDASPGTGDEVFIGAVRAALQHNAGEEADITLYQHARP